MGKKLGEMGMGEMGLGEMGINRFRYWLNRSLIYEGTALISLSYIRVISFSFLRSERVIQPKQFRTLEVFEPWVRPLVIKAGLRS
jgi:hypothetical protein